MPAPLPNAGVFGYNRRRMPLKSLASLVFSNGT